MTKHSSSVETETKHQPPGITTLPRRDTIQRHYCRRRRDEDNTSHLEHCKNNQTKQIDLDPNISKLSGEGNGRRRGDKRKGKDGRKRRGDEEKKGKMDGGAVATSPLASFQLVISKEKGDQGAARVFFFFSSLSLLFCGKMTCPCKLQFST